MKLTNTNWVSQYNFNWPITDGGIETYEESINVVKTLLKAVNNEEVTENYE